MQDGRKKREKGKRQNPEKLVENNYSEC